MIDELFDRTYQARRAEFNAGIGRAFTSLAAAVRNAFEVLNRIEYQAPWNERRSKAHCN